MDHQAIEIDELQDAAVENIAAESVVGSIGEDQFKSMKKQKAIMPEGLTSPRRNYDEASPVDAAGGSHDDTVTNCLARVRHRLGQRERHFKAGTSSCTIFRIPPTLCGINPKAEHPEIVSIGPYHKGQDHLREFEEHKWFFLRRFLHRTSWNEANLIDLMAAEENSARSCYSEPVLMPSDEFVEMMLLDSCFVLEFLLHIFSSDGAIDGDPIFTRPWIIPIVIRDLLKLENQVPYSLLLSLFHFSEDSTTIAAEIGSFCKLALKVFALVSTISMVPIELHGEREYKHLLDLFHCALSPTYLAPHNHQQNYRPSNQSIPCVARLWPSGIKFKAGKTDNFFDISFRKGVLEIPSITVNDFLTTVLINCIALERCSENSSENSSENKHITDYVSFMHCLINQPKDVSLLCSDGIITRFSHDDQYVANLFNKLGKSIIFNVNDCYLSKQFKELELYYNSNWAYIRRTYFSSPWSVMAVFSAFLGIALTMTQTVCAVLGRPR